MSTTLVLLRNWQASQIEFWRPTKYAGYDVSNFGNVRSWWGKGSAKNGAGPTGQSCLLKASPAQHGYVRVSIGNGVGPIHVHRLIAEVFVPNPDSYNFVNHLTGIKYNNWADNLEWTTNAGNMRHAVAVGLVNNTGSRHGMAKLTEAKVLQVWEMRGWGFLQREIADCLNVSLGAINDILRSVTWKHVHAV